MSELTDILLLSWIAGITAFLGGLIARYEGSANTKGKAELIHGVVAFGGGILLGAIAFSLAPEAMAHLGPGLLAATFCLGGGLFCAIDIALSRNGGNKAQFIAMLVDFVPEAIALGALFSRQYATAVLLAGFIAAQNLPEGFNAFRELHSAGLRRRRVLGALLGVSLLGPIAALSGYLWLRELPELTAAIMSFAAGGILYLVFQDIAPQATMRRHWTPPLGAVLGFLVGMVGKQLVSGP